MRALVIDDEAGIREIVAAYLEPLGYEVLTADRAERGLALAAKQAPDIVIVDLMMPDMDGYAFCRALRQATGTPGVPVIMITASHDPALTGRAYAAGAQACVPKPFRREALITAVQAVVAGRPRAKP